MDFDNLVDSCQKSIYNLAYRLLDDREEAADVTQETFIAAYKSWDSFRGESSEYTWLYRIAVNLCKNRFRQRDRMRKHEGPSLGDIEWSDDKPSHRPDGVVETKELKEMIERAISRLPDDYKIMVVLRDMQGLSYADVAETTGLSVDVVKTRLARARAMLRKKLGAYIDG